MKQTFRTLLLLLCTAAALPAAAQISVDKMEVTQDDVDFRDTLLTRTDVDPDYYNRARYRAERAAIRKERNYLEISGGVQGGLTAYNDSWIATSGGDNSIALTAVFDLKHTFKKNKFTIETRASAKFGYNRMKVETTVQGEDGEVKTSRGIWFKNQDEFEISTAPSFTMTKNWSYGTIIKYRSQFANGYKSRTEQQIEDRKSRFMTPGYLDVSLGFTYSNPKPKFPIKINLSPLALNATFAENDRIRWTNGFNYGIEDPEHHTSMYEGGSSLQIDLDRTFGKTGFLRYRTMFYGFYGWISLAGQPHKYANYGEYKKALEAWKPENGGSGKISDMPRLPIHPIVRWTNTIDIKATKYLTTQINFELYYNRAQNPNAQIKTLLSVGLVYTFKNK